MCARALRARQPAPRAVRAVVALARSTEASVVALSRPEIELDAPAARHTVPQLRPRSVNALEDDLTRRELEVLSMLAEGETNARIAADDRLGGHGQDAREAHPAETWSAQPCASGVTLFPAKDAPFEEGKSPLGSMRGGS